LLISTKLAKASTPVRSRANRAKATPSRKRKRVIDDEEDGSENEQSTTPVKSEASTPSKSDAEDADSDDGDEEYAGNGDHEDDEDDNDEEVKTPSPKKKATKKKTPAKKKKIEDDDDEDDDFLVSEKNNKPVKKTRGRKKKVDDDDDEDEDYDAEEKPKKKAPAKKATPKKKTPAKRKKVVDDDDEDDVKDEEDEDEDKEEEDFEFDEDESKKKGNKKTAAKKKATPKKKSSKKKKDDDEEPPKKKRRTKKEKEEEEGEEEEGKKVKGKKKKKEEEEIYKWWLEEDFEEKLTSDVKWTTLKHNGVIFPPDYKPHGVAVLYKGKVTKLSPEAEELATMYAIMKETDYYTNPVFLKNFWKEWQKRLGKDHTIKDVENCDFSRIWEWHLTEKEKKNNRSREEKKEEKEQREKVEGPYKYAIIDGRREKVANVKIEPPGLFRGRGAHPKQGMLKSRIKAEDVTINIGDLADAPPPPKGQKWGEVVQNNKVTWLAKYQDPMTKATKYVFLGASSSWKGVNDYLKYQTARSLKKCIDKIRKDYKKLWDSDDEADQQKGVAMYFIDKLALRVGNEKDDDKADTVGCCSIRVEHVKFKKDPKIELDFLGKDSIRYQNEVDVETKVYKLIKTFAKGKKEGDNLFDRVNPTILNNMFHQYLEKLTAKVFRTFNASLTLDTELRKKDAEIKDLSIQDKLAAYNDANREVAILCNHQRAAPKTFDNSLQTMDKKIEETEELLERLEEAKKLIKKKGYEEAKVIWDKLNDEKQEEYDQAVKEYEEAEEEVKKKAKELGKSVAVVRGTATKPKAPKKPSKRVLPKSVEAAEKQIDKTKEKIKDLQAQRKLKVENKTVALGTSRLNYCDPRITVAWCKRNEVPISKLFSKSLQDKFPWALDVEQDFTF
jgi:DNA topoisomerase-1